jgi:hypothetical protein
VNFIQVPGMTWRTPCQMVQVYFARATRRQQALELGCEQHAAALVLEVQRLHADAVAGEIQGVVVRIVDGDREHSVQARQAGDALALVQAQDHLGVRVRLQLRALRAQLGGEFHVVEDLAVLHHRDPAIVRNEGLVAAGNVDDGQAPVADGHAAGGLRPDTGVVGTAMAQLVAHGRQRRLVERTQRAVPIAEDAAHAQLLPRPVSRPRVQKRMRRSRPRLCSRT